MNIHKSIIASTADIIFVVSNEETLSIYKAIALSENGSTIILITKLGLRCRQYYSSTEKLMHMG